jgi:hypothetical protein
MANIYDMTDTWNNGATTFTAIKMDVSDAASASDSKLMDLQVDGSSKVVINKSGSVGIGNSPAVKLHIEQNQAAYTYCDLVNLTNGGGAIFRQIVRNIADSGTTTVDLAKLIGSGFVVNNYDTNAANFTAFGVGASERMRIDSSGNVGINTTTAAAKLEIGGAGEGIILASPDGTRYEITVANGGTLTVTAV